MPKFTLKREKRLTRDSKGRFLDWSGGKKKKDLKKKENTFHGIATHIGKQFKEQTGRVAKVGDITRDKNIDGSYHEQAYWYIRTDHGWRRSPTGTRKPSISEIKATIEKSRKGR